MTMQGSHITGKYDCLALSYTHCVSVN